MNKTLASFLVSALLLPAAALATDFEGTMTIKMSQSGAAGKGAGAEQQLNCSLKGGLTRTEIGAQGQGFGVIMDSAKHQMTILMTQQHMYMVRAMPTPTAAAAGSGTDRASGPALEKTGVTEKILGYDCTKYVMNDKDRSTELWLTGDIGQFMGFGSGAPMGGRGGPAPQGWEELVQGKEFFPMRVISTKGGKEVSRFEVTAVEKKSLPDDLFTVPAGWQDMGAMMRGMQLPPGVRIPGAN